jgi:Animal haem peroxidase
MDRPDKTFKGHGSELRGSNRVYGSSVNQGRFGRLFRWLTPAEFDEAALQALADSMVQHEFEKKRAQGKPPGSEPLDTPIHQAEPEDENPTIPAGYTYLGQFIDHDITFDPVSSLTAISDPDALHNFRTPRLDLDSMYGMGPSHQPYLYADDFKLLLGEDRSSDSRLNRPDLPRNNAHVRRALIGDKRNDENKIVSQLHSVFMRFHNAVVDHLLRIDFPHSRLFGEAQRIVRWHYQWVVLHDYLPTVVGEKMARAVRADGGQPDLRLYKPRSGAPFMPIEFSVAAYRFGHSMVRPSYALNQITPSGITTVQTRHGADKFNRIPIFSLDRSETASLNGFRSLPAGWGIDWRFFFDFNAEGKNPTNVLPQPSYRIDTTLVDPLADLPEFVQEKNPNLRSLGFRNLMRGWRLGLPSGQDVARLIDPYHEPFTDDQLFDTPERDSIYRQHRDVFYKQAPLWYYILKEAEHTRRDNANDSFQNEEGQFLGGHHLGTVGGRIVAEVLVGLVHHDHYSYMHLHPGWEPELSNNGTFSMADIINFADHGTVGH